MLPDSTATLAFMLDRVRAVIADLVVYPERLRQNLEQTGGLWASEGILLALVGQGLSMVTLCYMRRYVRFLQKLLEQESGTFALSSEVGDWLADTAAALSHVRGELGGAPLDASRKYGLLAELGEGHFRDAGSRGGGHGPRSPWRKSDRAESGSSSPAPVPGGAS